MLVNEAILIQDAENGRWRKGVKSTGREPRERRKDSQL